jgi:hypothetical protein
MLVFLSVLGCVAARDLRRSTPESIYPDIALALGETMLSCERSDDAWTRSTAVDRHWPRGMTKIFEMLTCWNEVTGSGTWYHRSTFCKKRRPTSPRACGETEDLSGPWTKSAQTSLLRWIEASGFEGQQSIVSAENHSCMDEINVLALETGPAGHLVIRGCTRFGEAEPLFRKIVISNINVPFDADVGEWWSTRAPPADSVDP